MKHSKKINWFLLILILIIFSPLLWTIGFSPIENQINRSAHLTLHTQIKSALIETEIGNATTAVLLKFRAYDTLLEVAVLVLSLVAATVLARSSTNYESLNNETTQTSFHPLLKTLVPTMVPFLFMIGAYLLWAGTKNPGGAFQAGSVWAVMGILLIKTLPISKIQQFNNSSIKLSILTFGSLAIFLIIGVYGNYIHGSFLKYPDGKEYYLVFFIETLIALSTAIVLTIFFSLGRNLIINQIAAISSKEK